MTPFSSGDPQPVAGQFRRALRVPQYRLSSRGAEEPELQVRNALELCSRAYFALAPSFVFVCFGFLGFFAFLSMVILRACGSKASSFARPRPLDRS
jgi:hypothetical protein